MSLTALCVWESINVSVCSTIALKQMNPFGQFFWLKAVFLVVVFKYILSRSMQPFKVTSSYESCDRNFENIPGIGSADWLIWPVFAGKKADKLTHVALLCLHTSGNAPLTLLSIGDGSLFHQGIYQHVSYPISLFFILLTVYFSN